MSIIPKKTAIPDSFSGARLPRVVRKNSQTYNPSTQNLKEGRGKDYGAPAGSGSGILHSTLSGLSSDDHPQYFLADGSRSLSGNLTLADTKNIILSTGTGTQIGTATTQKLSFYGATPIAQPANTVSLETVLSNLGLRASGTAAPLSIGALNCSTVTATGAISGSNLSGTNSGDQTITLTGDVTGSGTGSFAATIAVQNSSFWLGKVSDATGTGKWAFGTTPTFITNITVPLVIGGTGTTSTLILRSTSGVGASGADIVFQTGNNGATEALRILNAGTVGKYNAIPTVSNGIPSEIATIDSTGLTANVAASTLYAVPASGAGMYRVSAYVVETTAASVSSTLPNAQIVFTDVDSNSSITIDCTPILGVAGIGQTGALTANTIGTASSGIIVIYVKASTTIQYQTVNYASTAAGMTYALHIKLESL